MLIQSVRLSPVTFQDSGRLHKLYKLGQVVRAKVVEVSSQPQRLVLSLTGRGRCFYAATFAACFVSCHDG